MALKIDLIANTRQFQAEAKKAGKSVDDIGDSLDDVVKDGDRGLEKLERSFKDLATEADRTEKKVDDIGVGGSKGFGKASEAAGEFKSEALQNFSEVTSSFDGSMSSIGELAQGTLGGLASSLPGIGLAAGGAAVGVGLITSALEGVEERRALLTERANDLANAYIDAGTNVLDAVSIAARTSEIITGEERDEAKEYARVLGVDLPTAARAMAGDVNALAVVNKLASEAMDENRGIAAAQRESLKALTPEQQKQLRTNQGLIAAGKELNGVVDEANQKFNDQQAVLQGLLNDAGSATEEIDELGNVLYTLPDNTQIMIDAETGKATTDVSKFRGDLDKKIPTVKTTTIKVGVQDNTRKDVDRIVRNINGRVASISIKGNTRDMR